MRLPTMATTGDGDSRQHANCVQLPASTGFTHLQISRSFADVADWADLRIYATQLTTSATQFSDGPPTSSNPIPNLVGSSTQAEEQL